MFIELNDEEVAKLKAEHGPLVQVDTDAGPMVFRKATEADFNVYLKNIGSDRVGPYSAMKMLSRSCCVSPAEGEAFDTAVAELPGIVVSVNEAVSRHCGVRNDAVSKKL